MIRRMDVRTVKAESVTSVIVKPSMTVGMTVVNLVYLIYELSSTAYEMRNKLL
jgi:hypothetical protein